MRFYLEESIIIAFELTLNNSIPRYMSESTNSVQEYVEEYTRIFLIYKHVRQVCEYKYLSKISLTWACLFVQR